MKKCGRCKEQKSFSEFAKRYDWYESYCKRCQHEDYKQRYFYRTQVLKLPWKNRNKEYKERNRRFLIEYLTLHPCVDCGETDLIVLEFDHVQGKKRDAVGQLVVRKASLESIKAEIEKCVVRCANCHRRKTARSDWARVRFVRADSRRAVDEEPLALDFPPEYSCLVLRP